MGETNLTIRIDVDLKAAFIAACKVNDVNGSQVLRAAIRSYVEGNAQAVLPLVPKKSKGV